VICWPMFWPTRSVAEPSEKYAQPTAETSAPTKVTLAATFKANWAYSVAAALPEGSMKLTGLARL